MVPEFFSSVINWKTLIDADTFCLYLQKSFCFLFVNNTKECFLSTYQLIKDLSHLQKKNLTRNFVSLFFITSDQVRF